MSGNIDKTVIVTGGTRGVGAVTARELASRGARVVVTGRTQALGEQVAGEICEAGGQAIFASHNVSSEADWASVMEACLVHYDSLHALVNNAGLHAIGPLESATLEDFNSLVDTNLKGVFLGAKAAIPVIRECLAEGNVGNIVNVSSIAGLVGTANQSLYNLTKGGLQMFTKSLALEMAELRTPIRVNTVNPGVIDNDMGQALAQGLVEQSVFADTEAANKYLRSLIPLRRYVSEEEVAKAIAFLLSDDADYMTGTELTLDGGFTAR